MLFSQLNQAMTESLSEAKTIEGAAGDLLVTAVDNYKVKSTNLEEILFEKILSAQPTLERFLPFMALTAASAPLLGLLGTVTGMIKTFTLITIFGTGDAKSLSSGISEALVTTELGLIVAIPSLILHGLLSRMAKQKVGDLEQISVSFINGITGIKNVDQINVSNYYRVIFGIWGSGGWVMIPLCLLAILIYTTGFEMFLFLRSFDLKINANQNLNQLDIRS